MRVQSALLSGLLILLCGCGNSYPKLRENGSAIHSSVDGRYYWYYHTWKGHYYINVVSSASPTGPWMQNPDPLLEPGTEAFESKSVACATVVEEAGTFYMFYSGENPKDNSWSVALAVASHPLGPWHKVGELLPGFGYVTSVSHHDGRYFMYAQSNQQNDPRLFICITSRPLDGRRGCPPDFRRTMRKRWNRGWNGAAHQQSVCPVLCRRTLC